MIVQNKLKKEVLLRPHRGGLAGAMPEARAFQTRAELISFLNEILKQYYLRPRTMGEANFKIKPYGGYDDRTGRDTYIVCEEGYGVFSFTNGPLT